MAKTKGIDHTEAEVKKWVKDVLKKYNVYCFMPVQSGYGASGLDFHCVVNWYNVPYAFFIETKEFGKEPTDRQDLFIKQRRHHQKAKTFVIDGMVGVNELEMWLERIKQKNEKYFEQLELDQSLDEELNQIMGATDGHSGGI